jgi:hypothetical protein
MVMLFGPFVVWTFALKWQVYRSILHCCTYKIIDKFAGLRERLVYACRSDESPLNMDIMSDGDGRLVCGIIIEVPTLIINLVQIQLYRVTNLTSLTCVVSLSYKAAPTEFTKQENGGCRYSLTTGINDEQRHIHLQNSVPVTFQNPT